MTLSHLRRTGAYLAIFSLFMLVSFAGTARAVDKDLVENEESLEKVLALKGAKYVGSADCSSCHEKEDREYKTSTHARISSPDAEVKDCEMCHGPASIHIDEGGGRGSILNPKKNPSTCFSCHTDKKLQFRLPYHHPLLEGKMSCSDCHSAHGEEVRPWSSTSMKDVNEACTKCHKDQNGPWVWGHEALKEGCTTCHQVHGSINEKMLVAQGNNLCLRCHTQLSFPKVGKSNHADRLPTGGCYSGGCHTAPHGSNFDEHLRY